MSNQNVKISFIPKEPLLRGDVIVRKRPIVGLSFFISLLIFAIAFVGAGGVYFYKKAEYDNLIQKQEQLKETNDQLEASSVIQSIEELKILRDQIDHVSEVLNKHVALSAMFNFLEATTLDEVSFGSFSLIDHEDGKAKVLMGGQSKSFTSLANQSQLYNSRADILESFTLDGFRLTPEGTVAFNFVGVIDLETLYYVNTVGDEIFQEQISDESINEEIQEDEE